MDYAVKIRQAARRDIKNYFYYYLEKSGDIEIADRIVDKINSTIAGLRFMPRINQLIEELRAEGIRKIICGNFVIPFLINEERKTVSVLRVFHGKMDYKNYL